jgi:hypothetical protein
LPVSWDRPGGSAAVLDILTGAKRRDKTPTLFIALLSDRRSPGREILDVMLRDPAHRLSGRPLDHGAVCADCSHREERVAERFLLARG